MVVVEDSNFCQSSPQSVTISQPAQITFTVGVTNVTSFGGSDGSITVLNVMGGSGSYMYSIGSGFQTSPTFPGLIAGMYTVTVRDDSSGCTSQQSVTITSPSPTTSSAGVTNLTCIGRSNNNSCTVLSRYWLKSRSIPSAEKSINVASSNRRKVQSRYWQKSAPITTTAGVTNDAHSGGSNANRPNVLSRYWHMPAPIALPQELPTPTSQEVQLSTVPIYDHGSGGKGLNAKRTMVWR